MYLPVEGLAIDIKTEFPSTLFFVITRVNGGTVLVESDSSNGTSKPFRSMDEFSQAHKGEVKIKEQCEIESLEKWGVNLSDEVVKINILPSECEPPQGGQCHRWSR
jgi:hypothetical protein